MEIIMPKMGDAMTEGKVIRWYKKAGEAVKKGDPLLEIETDKVNLDLEAEQDGTIGEVSAQEGQVVPVGGRLAMISAPGESVGAGVPVRPAAETVAATQRRKTDKKDSIKHTTGEYAEAIEMKAPRVDRAAALEMPKDDGGRRRSSPLARKVARELGVSLDQIQGSGPQGRIVAADVKGSVAAPAPGAVRRPGAAAPTLESKSIPLTAMRRTIAKRLAESTGPI